MTKEMYEDLLERNRLQISELNMLTKEQDKRIAELMKKNANLKVLRKYELNIAKLDIEKLEKQNAELKEAVKHFNPCGEWNDDIHDCELRHYSMEYGDKLTKAT